MGWAGEGILNWGKQLEEKEMMTNVDKSELSLLKMKRDFVSESLQITYQTGLLGMKETLFNSTLC